MIINESGLLAAMKKAYSGGGYHVASGMVGVRECMLIASYGYSWGVVIHRENVPRKVLGLIAEHIGKLPELEEAFRAKKDEDAQDEIYSVAVKPIVSMLEQAKRTGNPQLRKTKLTWDGRSVWQQASDLHVVFLDPKLENITVMKDKATTMVEHCLHVRGEISQAFIGKIAPHKGEEDAVDHMSKVVWR